MRGTRKIAAVLLTAVMLNTLTGCSVSTFKESWQTLLGKSESNTLTAAQMQEMKDKRSSGMWMRISLHRNLH